MPPAAGKGECAHGFAPARIAGVLEDSGWTAKRQRRGARRGEMLVGCGHGVRCAWRSQHAPDALSQARCGTSINMVRTACPYGLRCCVLCLLALPARAFAISRQAFQARYSRTPLHPVAVFFWAGGPSQAAPVELLAGDGAVHHPHCVRGGAEGDALPDVGPRRGTGNIMGSTWGTRSGEQCDC